VILGEVLARQQVIDKSKTLLQTFAHGNGHHAVQFDNRGWLNPKQLVIERRNLAPVRGGHGGTFGVNGRNGRLQSVRTEAARSKRAFGQRDAFGDLVAVPQRAILLLQQDQISVARCSGGPLVLPKVYDGHDKTFSFFEYQGFRQVLGTTQVFAVPTQAERQGIDTTTYPGDILYVLVNPAIAPLLNRYPLPNDPQGAFGARTYATYSKIDTSTNQFSIRVDQKLSDKSTLFGRFSLNQVNGPITNPDQTAIDPTFGVNFFDHQRIATIGYARNIASRLTLNAAFGYVRSTPIFPTQNTTDPALVFGDDLYEGFNTADGSIIGSYGNVYQAKTDMAWAHGAHTFKWGLDIRLNKDATIFGTNPNGLYTFGGGTSYSPLQILSASGQHNIRPGQPLPDALTGLLTATPYSYTITAAANVTSQGNKFDEAAVRRDAYDFYFQDAWKISPRWVLTYGLRYELNSPIREAHNRTSVGFPVDAQGNSTSFFVPGARQIYTFNPQPIYPTDWRGFGPRVAIDFAATKHTTFHAGAAITTLLPNLWQTNFVTGGFPLVFQPLITASPGTPVPFHTTAVPLQLPPVYTTSGQPLFPGGDSTNVLPNTQIDVQRYQADVEALTPATKRNSSMPPSSNATFATATSALTLWA
jgi:TonB dependent receptor